MYLQSYYGDARNTSIRQAQKVVLVLKTSRQIPLNDGMQNESRNPGSAIVENLRPPGKAGYNRVPVLYRVVIE